MRWANGLNQTLVGEGLAPPVFLNLTLVGEGPPPPDFLNQTLVGEGPPPPVFLNYASKILFRQESLAKMSTDKYLFHKVSSSEEIMV